MSIGKTAAWQLLEAHRDRTFGRTLRERFATDPRRFEALSFRLGDLLVDFSKQRIDRDTLDLLLQLAEVAQVDVWRDRQWAGEPINDSEGRAVMHVALRGNADDRFVVAGHDLMPEVLATRARLGRFAESVRGGAWHGYAGQPIRHVVNLGIGGSDLGPRMATVALSASAHPALSVDYVSNIDAADLAPLLARLDPRTTLFIVASKTFTTLETLRNAHTARDWLLLAAGEARDEALARQFVGVTANPDAALAFGIAPDNLFAFRDWVGGRFSLWSAIGLPLLIAIGEHAFLELLAGARTMDRHFRDAPPAQNIPLLMALIGVWNIDFLGAGALSIAPYSQSLHHLPQYLQQLEMESNGKQVRRDGEAVGCATAPVILGDAGTNAQHAYFQLLHQGERIVPSDFIALAEADYPLPGHHPALLGNCLAQSEALAFGNPECADPRKRCPGNQPSTTIVLPRLDPFHLGLLLALYEHKTFVQGVVWGINSFDQWGVELGKKLAGRLTPLIEGGVDAAPELDSSTAGLIAHLRHLRHE